MKLNVLCRHKYFLLACSAILNSGYPLCGSCEECTAAGSNAASEIQSSAIKDTDDELGQGWLGAYPMFEGDYFSVILPIEDPPEFDDTNARRKYLGNLANQTVKKVLSKLGFEMSFVDSGGVNNVDSEFFDKGPFVAQSGGGDILKVAQINCKTRPNTYPDKTELQPDPTGFCNIDPENQKQLISRVTNMDADKYLDRTLTRFNYFQRPGYREWPVGQEAAENLKACVPPLKQEANDRDSEQELNDCLDVFIEHAAIMTTFDLDNKKALVKGRIFPKYKITNNRTLDPVKAVARAYEKFPHIVKVKALSPRPPTRKNLPLVLLPYKQTGQLPQLKYAYRTTLWGTEYMDDDGQSMEAASWRAWIDADTGDILELVPLFAFGGEGGCVEDSTGVCVKGKGWPLHPSSPVFPPELDGITCDSDIETDDCPSEMSFEVDATTDGRFCLKLAGVFDEIKYEDTMDGSTFEYTLCSDFESGLDCKKPKDCLVYQNGDNLAIDYLLMNAYAHVYAYRKKLDYAICGSPNVESPADGTSNTTDNTSTSTGETSNPPDEPSWCHGRLFKVTQAEDSVVIVPLRIRVGGSTFGTFKPAPVCESMDADGNCIWGKPRPHLSYGHINYLFKDETKWSDADARVLTGSYRPGAQDATLMTHEFAHAVSEALEAGLTDDWCRPDMACPVPINSSVVHDMADGLSAVSNVYNWFGAWWGNGYPVKYPDKHSEWSGRPRKFDYTKPITDDPILVNRYDHFPEHREYVRQTLLPPEKVTYTKKGYADGQIAATALWAVTEGVMSRLGEIGVAAFEANLLNVLPYHYVPNACPFSKQGEDCDYADDCDLEVYRYLHFLLANLIDNEIATHVTEASNKLTAGFARTGIFLVPPQCISADTGAPPSAALDSYCPSGPYGGDAVIDVSKDWLKRGSEVPKFEVWTGPKYKFVDALAVVQQADQQPCNSYYKITIADNPEFSSNGGKLSKETEWRKISGECYGSWEPTVSDEWKAFWNELSNVSTEVKIYYRVVTRENETAEAMQSSSLNPGLRVVEPPFAVLNDTGKP